MPTRVWNFTLTLSTVAQSLHTLIGATTAGKIGLCQYLTLQAHTQATAVIKVGGSVEGVTSVTTGNWGIIIPIPTSNVPAAPLPFEKISLADLYVLGGNTTDKVNVFVQTA